MAVSPPEIIAIEHDDYYASYVGHTADGKQFFLTNPFVPKTDASLGREFLALYLFNESGQFLEAFIDDLGPRASMDVESLEELRRQRLNQLGSFDYGRIEVAPFEINRFGTAFGLIARLPEDEDDVWAVEVHPGNYMAFFEPWDSGEYDT